MKILITSLLLFLLISCHQEKKQKKPLADNAYYDRAWFFLDNNLPDSSFIYFNKAKEKSLKDGDKVKVAKCLINMAIISGDKGDYFGSQEISLSAIAYLNPSIQEQREILSSNYNNLGKMAHVLKKYEEANQFYLKSIEFTKNENSRAIYFNNIAINLSSYGKYSEALKYFEKLMGEKGVRGNPITYSRILSNSAKTKWMQNPSYKPVSDFLKALNIREREKDLWGQNASLGHLVDYYIDVKPDSALFYTHKKYKIAQAIRSADDQLNSLQKLIKLSPIKDTKRYFEIYQHLDDSVQVVRSAAKNQFALIRYETEKNKAENLNLQKDVNEKKYQITRQRFLIIGALILIIGGSVIGLLWYKKRKQKIELEAENTIRDNKLKIHKKVHDVVANGLYTVMSEIENKEELDKEKILDRIEILYERSRGITYDAYDETPIIEPDLKGKINSLIASYGTQKRRVSLVGNEDELWEQVSAQAKYEIMHILQELMVNMDKHSAASNVVIKFERIKKQLNIYYTDDGIGIKGIPNFNNGLTNTGNRIQSIGGEITFDSNNERGLSIHIFFPTT
ncbi:tetratricopeptide repeat-containing sensor histidine kinase [Pedobacter sp. B4-66]|uniref:tetratricopeptide repeat-containing sensor histidine kinase n=1 Tax=Pedobacter sp. B4-66 TaxID=2817280 RepID=UPI001BDA6B30|nr:tetratricopeptide repeat-containing sensor histidine kinase [Pedobacter sp. B4-66]